MRRNGHADDRARAAAAVGAALALAGCAAGDTGSTFTDPHSRPIARGARYHPTPGAEPGRGLQCRRRVGGPRFGVHLELFANRFVVVVPPGIGVAPPRVRRGAYVIGGRCSYPARTVEPTGVIQVESGGRLTLGDFFAIWGRLLSSEGFLSFRGPVTIFVAGKRWAGDPAGIPLARHAEITLEVGSFVPPRVGYRFRPGL